MNPSNMNVAKLERIIRRECQKARIRAALLTISPKWLRYWWCPDHTYTTTVFNNVEVRRTCALCGKVITFDTNELVGLW